MSTCRGVTVLTLVFVFVAVWCNAGTTSLISNPGGGVRPQCANCKENKTKPFQSDWDYLKFVNQWPESFCLYYNSTHNHNHRSRMQHRCIIPSRIHKWTIHGTWPTKQGTEGPTSCNNTWQFDLSEIKDLVPVMNNTWPDYLTGEEYWCFWAHEWDKHGTCAASLPALQGQHNFFEMTLKQKQRFDIDSMLNTSGIVPSSTARYNYDDILQAIKKGTGGIPELICFQDNGRSGFQQYLAEIRMCLDKTFQPFDCPKSEFPNPFSGYYDPCSPKTTISLPPIKH